MTSTLAPTAAPGRSAVPGRGNVRASGIFYLITFAASIPALILIGPALNDADYITSAGQDNRVLAGSLLDFVNALTAVGSAVAIYPVLKRLNQSMALGFVISRMTEAAVIMSGVISLMAVVTLRQEHAGGDVEGLGVTGQALVAIRDWSFVFGPGFMPAFNALLFATLLYKSGWVPRWIPTLGLIGAPLLFSATTLNVFGYGNAAEGPSLLAAMPIAVWEVSIGLYMTFRGFRSVE